MLWNDGGVVHGVGTVLYKQLSSIQVELTADDRAPVMSWLSLVTG